MREDPVRLFLAGDVMLGRGIDQILPFSCPPRIYEPAMTSAMGYVTLAERQSGPIPRPVDFAYVWGDTVEILTDLDPDARIVNLETSITLSEDAMPKGINYRMHPGNVPVLLAAGIDCCVLANNHVLDWGVAGLGETLEVLAKADIPVAGAGGDRAGAAAPAVLPAAGGRTLVFACCVADSGVPPDWTAEEAAPGVNLLPDLSPEAADSLGRGVRAAKRPGDVAVLSIHWGGNWGYGIPSRHRRFAHAVIDRAAIDLVYGHSSHHPRPIEIYRNRLILYGCGDFLDDYEGIRGYEEYRDDLVLMYFPTVEPSSGALLALEMIPLQIRKFRLNRPSGRDTAWLHRTLDRECRRFGTRVARRDDRLVLDWR